MKRCISRIHGYNSHIESIINAFLMNKNNINMLGEVKNAFYDVCYEQFVSLLELGDM